MEQFLDLFDGENKKSFNTTGACRKDKHYMVNIDNKLKSIIRLVQGDNYFVINRPRQYGKTTTLHTLEKILKTRYKVVSLDFEGIGVVFESEREFCNYFSKVMNKCMSIDDMRVFNFIELGDYIKDLTQERDIILIIDEVDKASNNELFLDFLGMLRSLYLSRAKGESNTFKSVILAGVHDVKNLKLKFRDGSHIRYNSPWNIAVNFEVDMSFNKYEIATMLEEYASEKNLCLNIEQLSEAIYKFTSGYPFLVSRICQLIDDKLLKSKDEIWDIYHIQRAVKLILEESNTLFDDLVKNLENNKELYDYMYRLLILNIPLIYNIDDPITNEGVMYGYFSKNESNNLIISNRIIRERIYNYLVVKTDNREMAKYNYKDNFIIDDNGLDMEKVLLKFQQFMKENYSSRDEVFLERHGVLLFLSFIKPIINGVGFDYKEVQISEERRLDIVISYNHHKYIIETKVWHGEVAHRKGLKQLSEYLDIEGVYKGYLLIFNFNKSKEYKYSTCNIEGKSIFEVRV